MSYTFEIPPRKKPQNDAGYLEILTQAVFQSGFSWEVIRDKWPNFREAFAGFDIPTVAAYGDEDVDRLLKNRGIVRNGRKITSTIQNARIMRELIAQHGSIHGYLRSLDGMTYPEKRHALTQRFHHLGPTGCFVFLYMVDEEVPNWDDRAS
jgi:3-methyladenine DNA glycosylase Tag